MARPSGGRFHAVLQLEKSMSRIATIPYESACMDTWSGKLLVGEKIGLAVKLSG